MTAKTSPKGAITQYTFRPDGTVLTLTKPGGAVTTVDAVLSHPASYDPSGALVRRGSYIDVRGVALVGELDTTPELLATTDTTIRDVATGAVRYAGSVAKLLPEGTS